MRLDTTTALLVCVAACLSPSLKAQALPSGTQTGRGKLAFLLPDLYGPAGLTLPNPDHQAHFDSAFQNNFGPFNSAMATQLTSLPIPSPASGFTYTFDPALGVYRRSGQSFGPILAERAETIGKGKFFFGFSHQQFKFDSLDGTDLSKVPSVFTHSPGAPEPAIGNDLITTNNFLDIRIAQTTTFFTYGLHDRFDVSVALPYLRASMNVSSDATVQRIGTSTRPNIHYFLDANGNITNRAQFNDGGSATGIGDVIFRLKGTVLRTGPAWLAVGADIRTPTGDEYDFLGSGALGVRPFAALSFRSKHVSPHINVGYQWNDSSVLAGDIRTGRKGHLPNQFTYAAGIDAGISPKFTLAFDVLGAHIYKALRVNQEIFTAANSQQFPQISFKQSAVNVTNASAGFKVNPIGTMLVSFNLLMKVNDAGLRDRVTPLIGVSYSF
jgi:hypothetical protein